MSTEVSDCDVSADLPGQSEHNWVPRILFGISYWPEVKHKVARTVTEFKISNVLSESVNNNKLNGIRLPYFYIIGAIIV